MTGQYLIGELSVRLEQLQAVAGQVGRLGGIGDHPGALGRLSARESAAALREATEAEADISVRGCRAGRGSEPGRAHPGRPGIRGWGGFVEADRAVLHQAWGAGVPVTALLRSRGPAAQNPLTKPQAEQQPAPAA